MTSISTLHWTDQIVSALTQMGMRRHYGAGDVLFEQGDPPAHVMLVESGTVAVDYGASARHGGEETAQAGALIGGCTVLRGHAHTATATAQTPATLWYVSAESFHRLARSGELGPLGSTRKHEQSLTGQTGCAA